MEAGGSAGVYRVLAGKCAQLAHAQGDAQGKLELLDMAMAWLALDGNVSRVAALVSGMGWQSRNNTGASQKTA